MTTPETLPRLSGEDPRISALLISAGSCSACWLYQHHACEAPLSCRCSVCHPGRAVADDAPSVPNIEGAEEPA